MAFVKDLVTDLIHLAMVSAINEIALPIRIKTITEFSRVKRCCRTYASSVSTMLRLVTSTELSYLEKYFLHIFISVEAK
jgi:hypothetical protein